MSTYYPIETYSAMSLGGIAPSDIFDSPTITHFHKLIQESFAYLTELPTSQISVFMSLPMLVTEPADGTITTLTVVAHDKDGKVIRYLLNQKRFTKQSFYLRTMGDGKTAKQLSLMSVEQDMKWGYDEVYKMVVFKITRKCRGNERFVMGDEGWIDRG